MELKYGLAAVALLAAVTAGAAGFPYPYQVHRLDNGLKVIFIPTPAEDLAAYWSIVRTGSRDEVEVGHTGFAHFFEHMMFRGTERYPGPVYDRIMTSLGADANAYTTDDYTAYHLNVASADLPRVIELEADRFQRLSYAEREFQTEAGAVYGEYRKGRTSPYWVLFEALQDTAFDVHTYQHTTIGFEPDIAAMPTMYDYSKSFFKRYYRPENVVLVVTGDFDPEATLALIRDHYGAWEAGYVAPAVPAEPEQKAPRFAEVTYDGRTLPLVAVAWKSDAFDPARTQTVAATLLGELAFGETSEVYRDLVLDRQLAQRLSVDFGFSRDPGLWTVIASVKDEASVPEVRRVLEEAVARFAAVPPAGSALEDLKSRVRYGFLMALDTPDNVAGNVAQMVAISGGLEAAGSYLEAVQRVSPADVQAAAARFFVPARRTTVVLEGVAE